MRYSFPDLSRLINEGNFKVDIDLPACFYIKFFSLEFSVPF